MRTASLLALATRPSRSLRLIDIDRAEAIAGLGLQDDIHADPLSTRQILLASADVYRTLALPPHALRENLLLDIDTASLSSGTVLKIGDTVRLRLMFQCEACGQLDLIRPGLARTLGERRGMLARVLDGGTLRAGDPVRDLGVLMPSWSDDWRVRVKRVLDAAPPDTVVEYRQLARLTGVQASYCRAFPRMLAKLGPGYADKGVAQSAAPHLPRWDGAGLFDDV
jgi:MOSC domain-containing protein YiiM